MFELLNKVRTEDLVSLVRAERIRQIRDIVEEKDFSEANCEKKLVINAISSLYGRDILSEKRIRQLLFYTLDENILIRLTKKYCKTTYEKSYDNAIELSLLPWRSGTEFVNEWTRLLNIPVDYLPTQSLQVASVEEIITYKDYNNLYDYQEELKLKIKDCFEKKTPRFLVQMPTGSGKTRTVMQSIIEYSQESLMFSSDKCIVWLAHTEELCEQAIDTFKKLWVHLCDSSVRIVRLWGGHNPTVQDLNGSFVFGTFQKVVSLYGKKSTLFEYLQKKTGIIAIDEAHKSTAKTYAEMLNSLAVENTVLLGITATPGRDYLKYHENKELAMFFDKVLLEPSLNGNPIKILQEKDILANLKRTVIYTGVDVALSGLEISQILNAGDFSQGTLNKLAENTSRNKIILELIKNEVLKKNPTLVFSCSTEHSKLLNSVLNMLGVKSYYIDSDTNKNNRRKIIEDFKRGEGEVLINYGILSTGFDVPRVKSIVVTRPTSSVVLYSQIVGRGLRGLRMGGNKDCNLFDIYDNYDKFGGVDEVYKYFEDYWT
jgi:DNA repair protein RadD